MHEQDRDTTPVVTDPAAGEPVDTGNDERPETHTAGLQGAVAGGAGSETGAGYLAGALTGSENGIGIAEIDPDGDGESDAEGDSGAPRD